jgi:hypothetical protein
VIRRGTALAGYLVAAPTDCDAIAYGQDDGFEIDVMHDSAIEFLDAADDRCSLALVLEHQSITEHIVCHQNPTASEQRDAHLERLQGFFFVVEMP